MSSSKVKKSALLETLSQVKITNGPHFLHSPQSCIDLSVSLSPMIGAHPSGPYRPDLNLLRNSLVIPEILDMFLYFMN